jgi:predicted DNA-binding protein YlxM (UPF0122 family)
VLNLDEIKNLYLN